MTKQVDKRTILRISLKVKKENEPSEEVLDGKLDDLEQVIKKKEGEKHEHDVIIDSEKSFEEVQMINKKKRN